MTHFADPVGNLRNLVAFPSVSNTPILDLCEWVSSACAHFGFTCSLEQDPNDASKANVVATIGPQVPGGLILSGHLDVVPSEGQPWRSDPFKLTEHSGRYFGRGASDMKGFIASTLASFSLLDLKKLRKPLVLLWTHDEEVGCKGSAQFAKRHAKLPDWFPKEALIGEPTDMHILRMHPGHVTVKITVKGKAAHSSKPDLGDSAIKAAASVLAILEELEKELMLERRFENLLERPYVTLNVGMIRGGQAVNIVPDLCELVVGYRPLPGDDASAVFSQIEQRIKNLNLRDAEVLLQTLTPALLTRENTPLQSLLEPHAHDRTVGAAAFATDGGNLSTMGIECLIFGPGSIDVAHKADEFIEASALLAAPKVIADIVRRRCE